MLQYCVMKELIVAYGLDREIGQDGDMPWGRNMPADLRHFKELTVGKTVIMGYNTYRSIGRPLADRQNIVVASRKRLIPCGVEAVRSLEQAYERSENQICVIGGAMLYAAALELGTIDVVHATEIQERFPGADTFFPNLPDSFVKIACECHPQDECNRHPYDYVTFAKQN